MKKGKKITLIVVSSLIVATLLFVGLNFGIDALRYDYDFQRLNVSINSCYIDEIEYTESTKTLNATINIRVAFVNNTRKEIGIDTNIITLYLGVLEENVTDLNDKEITALNGEEYVIVTYLGDYLEDNQYISINKKDIKIVNVAIPVSLKYNTNLTQNELILKLSNWKVSLHSTYLGEIFDGREMAGCSISNTIKII